MQSPDPNGTHAAREDIAALLRECERSGHARPYRAGGGDTPYVVEINAAGREVVLVSDLHIASGRGDDGRYGGTENFFFDDAFARFLAYHRVRLHGNGLLVVNGDFIDFLRIVELPDDVAAWRGILLDVGIDRSEAELAASIVPKERKYGLKTHDYKSVWRLHRAIDGHRTLFDALGGWLADGNALLVTKGNHDLEWYWPAVRNALRLALARLVSEAGGLPLRRALVESVLPHLEFADDAVLVDGELYIEHGHRYDRYTRVLGGATVGARAAELNIPFGSFFNRYLLNRLETDYPYLDNLRPSEALLPMLVREHFALALKVIFLHIPFMLSVIRKRYYRYMFGRVLWLALAIAAPVAAFVAIEGNALLGLFSGTPASDGSLRSFVWRTLAPALGSVGNLVVAYFLGRIVAWLQLDEPGSLDAEGRAVLAAHPAYRIATMGHTHNPDQFAVGGRWFYNSGTWIPVLSATSAEVRGAREFLFLHFPRDAGGRLVPRPLLRWNDDAGRPEAYALVRPGDDP